VNRRTLGTTGWDVTEVGLGTWNIGGGWGDISDEEGRAAVRAALDEVDVLSGDKGCGDRKRRDLAREHDVRHLIKHRELTPLHKAWNTRLDTTLYNRRNTNETVNAAIK
jgi:IS5 family transposase